MSKILQKLSKILINFVSYSDITRNNELLIVKHHLLSLFKSCKNINSRLPICVLIFFFKRISYVNFLLNRHEKIAYKTSR